MRGNMRWSRRLIALLLLALPVWAHGENVIYFIGLVYYALPAALLLFVPWHDRWARVLAAATLLACAVVLWSLVLPRVEKVPMSPVGECSFMLSPLAIAVVLAVVLRIVRKRAA